MAGALLLLGAGSVAEALAAALVPQASPTHAVFGDVLIWARRHGAAEELARRTGARALESLSDAVSLELEVIVFCVSDDAIDDVALHLAEAWPVTPRAKMPVALHTSGFHGIEVLASLASLGIERGGLHPVVSLAGLGTTGRVGFEGVRFGVSGDPDALEVARELALALGGVPLEVPHGGRALYHASAALLAGGVVALVAEAESALAEALPNVEPHERAALVRVLLASTVANLEATSPREALTGPVARGDVDVVAGHLACFEASATPQRAALYRELVRAMERLSGGRD
jgi:predicted short-subunit dehydrogenase-like oxidoreductase (DUF2520 family)